MTIRYEKTLKTQTRLVGGKLRRIYLSHLRRNVVKHEHERRRGEYARCSACCRFVFNCPFLKETAAGTFECTIHQKRPTVCANFPIDERDIAERELVLPETPCGFYFVEDAAEKKTAGK